MKTRTLVLALVGVLLLGTGFDVLALEAVSEEELLFMEIPIVVTASRKEQPVTEAPAAVTVITAEDIKQSGATNIPDILRTVPGVDMMAITARDEQVSIRGFNEYMSNKLLVMIDGRSIYWDAEGNVFWDSIPITLEEIERIEIVKGPGSSLYGANAYCGVINIITKSLDKTKGTRVSLTGGTRDTLLTSVLHSGQSEKVDYRVSAELDRTNEWRSDEKAGKITRANAVVEYKVGKESKLSVSGGRAHFKDRKLFTAEVLGASELTGDFDYVQLNYDRPSIKFRTFVKKENVDADQLRRDVRWTWQTETYDAEIQHSMNVGERNFLVSGASCRHNVIDKNSVILEKNSQNLWALFLEDEAKITDQVKLTLGGRYDWHPLVKERFSPRGNVLYSLNNHIFRLSAGKAYRNPAFVDSYIYQFEQGITPLPSPLPSLPLSYLYTGNKDLKPESVTSYEAGYRAAWLKKRVNTDMNLFYNKYTDLFGYVKTVTPYTSAELTALLGVNPVLLGLDPATVIPKHILSVRQNAEDAVGIGGEVSLDVLITNWLSGVANYSYQRIKDEKDNLFTAKVDEKGRVRAEYPKNKANVGLKMKLKSSISANLFAHWVDKTQRCIYDLENNEYTTDMDGYTIFNASVGYGFLKNNAEVSLSVFNLFNDKHYEYPVGVNLPDPSSDEVGRRVTANVSYKF